MTGTLCYNRLNKSDLGEEMVLIGFWIFMLIMDLLVPFTMIGWGKLFLDKAPKNINYTFGYRTTMSMKNQDTWQFAHKYCGKLWFRAD